MLSARNILIATATVPMTMTVTMTVTATCDSPMTIVVQGRASVRAGGRRRWEERGKGSGWHLQASLHCVDRLHEEGDRKTRHDSSLHSSLRK